MMHHFSYDGICVVCDEQNGLNEQHLCPGCFAAAKLYANDNRDDPTKAMSPWGAALFNCFRSRDPDEKEAALDNLCAVLHERLK